MLEKLPMILKFTLSSLNSVALLTTNRRESDQHSLSFFVPHLHYRVTKDLIERSFITVYSASRLKDKAYLKHYLTFYSFVLLHVLNGVLTKPYVATVTNLTRICAKTENMIVCRTYIIRCNIRDVHVKMR